MTVYCGVDFHARSQTVSYCDTADGELHQKGLDHRRDDLRAFYAQFSGEVIVGIEASGYSHWFEQLLTDLGRVPGRRRDRDQAISQAPPEERPERC